MRKPKPVPMERPLVALWHLLSSDQRKQLMAMGGLPTDYKPDLSTPATPKQQLEGARELERLAKMRPGLLGTWPEELVARVEPEEKGE